MAYDGYAIDKYLDASAVTTQRDELIKKSVYSVKKKYLDDYVENQKYGRRIYGRRYRNLCRQQTVYQHCIYGKYDRRRTVTV
jgi:hypothetical protein